MINLLNNNAKIIIFVLLLIVIATACFQNNFLKFSDKNLFFEFGKESEALVIGGIVADDFSLDKKGANIGFISKDDVFKYPKNKLDGYAVFSGKTKNTKLVFAPYKSQYGVQGVVFSKIHRIFGFNGLYQLQSINSILLAIVVVSLFFLYRHIYDNRFAVIFLITMLSSPWIVSFARNLYWVPFLWFLPALLAAIMYLKKGVVVCSILLLGIVASVFIKSLAGYEYLSTITLFACSVFMVAPFFKTSDRDLPGNLRLFVLVFIACVIGFVCALLVHANMRGDTILSGLKNILEQDVKRRTYGDSSLFAPVYKASLESSPLAVIKTYVISWGTPLVAWLPGKLFKFLICFASIGILYKFSTKHITMKREAILLVFFFIVPASWFVLAKGHSYIHTQLNYVLWYFGFVQALIYVTLNTIIIFLLYLFKLVKIANAKDSALWKQDL